MSGGLAPSKSTVYVSNLPFSLTNNDIHKIFEKYGQVVKVTVLKDKDGRKSRGVAFVLFLDRESAHACVQALHNTEMFGRTLKVSIAKDNGRAAEFIRRKEYKDKSRCYECGEEGHLSYRCPKNLLGDRQPPVKKKKTKQNDDEDDPNSDSDSEEDQSVADSVTAMLQYQKKISKPAGQSTSLEESVARKKYKKNSYFSDEEDLAD